MKELLIGVIAYFIAWALSPGMRKIALKVQFVDLPTKRKIHQQPLPLLGGAAIFAGFLIASNGAILLNHTVPPVYFGMIAGALILFIIGLVDDFFKTRGRDFPTSPRFVLQIVSAALVAGFGGTIKGFTIPFGHYHFVAFPAYLSICVTVIWIVGVINVFNFLDGMDGLAAGIAAISAVTLMIIAGVKHDLPSALLAASVAGAALGFLRHNFHPARIIMGDAGSTLLGFLLASIAVVGAFKSVTVISIFVPILALGVPIIDGLRVVVKRALNGKPVHKPDRTHGHYTLLDSGLSQVQTVAFMYLLSICCSLVSVIVVLIVK